MITPDEWESLCLLIDEGWPGEFSDASAKAWRLFLDDYDVEQVFVAIKALVARGGTFRPSVAEVVAEIRRDPLRPTFIEMVRLVFGSSGVLRARTPVRKASWEAGERDALDREAMMLRAAQMHPLIGAFVDREGLDRLRALGLDDEEWGEARRRQLQVDWDAFVEAHEGREVAAIASGRRGELGRFDPLAVLDPRVTAPQIEGGL